MNIVFFIFGIFIAIGSFGSATLTYSLAKSSIHEIYAALLMITSVLGLVVAAIGWAASSVRNAILKGDEQAVAQRKAMIDGINIFLSELPPRPSAVSRDSELRAQR